MPQQINLCTPILLTQKRYFSAQTMVQALALFVLLGGGLCAYWVWSLNRASAGFQETLATQSRELDSLKAAVQQSQAGSGPAELSLAQALQGRQSELVQREKLMQALQRGLFVPGWGHSARLQLLARTIPARVWLTGVKADADRLEVSGFTLEPSELNAWVSQLAASPLLQGQALATVKVERASAAELKTAVRPMWSFSLLSAVGKPAAGAGGTP